MAAIFTQRYSHVAMELTHYNRLHNISLKGNRINSGHFKKVKQWLVPFMRCIRLGPQPDQIYPVCIRGPELPYTEPRTNILGILRTTVLVQHLLLTLRI